MADPKYDKFPESIAAWLTAFEAALRQSVPDLIRGIVVEQQVMVDRIREFYRIEVHTTFKKRYYCDFHIDAPQFRDPAMQSFAVWYTWGLPAENARQIASRLENDAKTDQD